MKILYISKYAATPVSGIPTRQYFFSKYLAELGNKVLLVYSKSNGKLNNYQSHKDPLEEVNGNLQIKMLNGPQISMGMNLKRVWSWIVFEYQLYKHFNEIKDFQPEIIIVSSLSILTFQYGIFLKKHLRQPLVLEVRDLYPLTLIEVGNKSKYNPMVKFLSIVEKYGYKNADLIISSLENTKEYFEARKGGSVNFKWLPMGFDPDIYEPVADNYTLDLIDKIIELKLKGNFIIGYAGSIGKANALEEILNLSMDKDIILNHVYFVIIGQGTLLEKYKIIYSNENVSFFNSVSKRFLPLLLQNCDLLINTWLDKKIYQYGISPNKWIEYMYSGRPILLSFNGRSSIFTKADCGWQLSSTKGIHIKNKILKIRYLPSDLLDKKGKNGREYLLTHLNYLPLAKELEVSLKYCIDTFKRQDRFLSV